MKEIFGAIVLFVFAAGVGAAVVITTPHATSTAQSSSAAAQVDLVATGVNVIARTRAVSSTDAIDCAMNTSCVDPTLLGGR